MSKASKNKKSLFGTIETLISQDTKVEGTIEANGTLRIDGTVIGGISKAAGVIIGESGMVEGNIVSQGVSLAGKVKGNILADTSLELMQGSILKGDIKTTQLSIAEGAHFDGACTMIDHDSSDSDNNEKASANSLEPTEEPT